MSEASHPAPQTPNSEFLFGFWYPALRSAELGGRELRAAMLLDQPLVLGRDARGRPYALRDLCPHRGMPLSFGQFDGEAVECCYHGWRFEPHSGQCREIPSLTADAKLKLERIFATAYPCAEQDGYVWVYLPDCDARNPEASALPPVPHLPLFSPRYRMVHAAVELPVSADQGISGLLDPAHGPFVHQSWFWRSSRNLQEKEKTFEPIPNGFRMRAHAPSANTTAYKLLRLYGHHVTTAIDFTLPNRRVEEVRCGPYWFVERVTVTPLTTDRCRMDFCAAWNIFSWLPFIVPLFGLFARAFLRQDQRAMEKLAVGLKHKPPTMLVDDADRPIRWYVQLKAACREAQRTGQPMQHPLAGPVTLRWRS